MRNLFSYEHVARWLCAQIIEAAERLIASRYSSLGWTMLALSEPIKIVCLWII